MKKILFHYPGPFYEQEDSGEKVRPKRMYKAFEDLGYEVTAVIGNYAARKVACQQAMAEMAHFAFLYSENRTLPLRLVDKTCVRNMWNNIDLALFRMATAHRIPWGVFYRDLYWRFRFFRKRIGLLKYCLALPYYWEELRFYQAHANVIFTPSKAFARRLPGRFIHYVPLPPGADIIPGSVIRPCRSVLQLIYIGSISPPVYNIAKTLADVAALPSRVFLTVVTRPQEWACNAKHYTWPSNVAIRHMPKERLRELLLKSDVAVMYEGGRYGTLAMPLKLFEALGAGLPVVWRGPGAAAEFIHQHQIGWVVPAHSGGNIFEWIISHPSELISKRENVLRVRAAHTWRQRAAVVARFLAGASMNWEVS